MSQASLPYPPQRDHLNHREKKKLRLFPAAIFLVQSFILAVLPVLATADELPAATDPVILKASGKLTNSNTPSGVELDLAMLEALPAVTFSTESPWTEGVTEWTGVRLNELLTFIGATSNRFVARALDDYEVTFEKVDLDKHPVILAYKQNGEYMSVRALGPLWIMFPFDDYPETDTQFNRSLAVWQLIEIEVL